MNKIINLFIAFFLILTTITSAAALSTNIYWENDANETTIMNSENASYYIYILPDFNANQIQVTSTLYNLDTQQVVDVLYSNTFTITNPNNYITINQVITQSDYVSQGNFLLNVNVLQNSNVVTQRSKILNLEVTNFVSPANINADFTFNPQNPLVNQIVNFTQNSTSDNQIVLYEWFVDNQKVGEGQTLLRTFTNQGTYDLSLKITDNQGNKDEVTKTVVVSNPVFMGPTANFTFNPESPFVGNQVTFTSTSTQGDSNIVLYNWSINGIFLNQNNSFFTWTFNYASSFEVSLTVTDANGLSDSITKTVVVSNQPIQTILIDELGCNANVVQGNMQHCSVHTSTNSQSEAGVQVTFRYQDTNELLGTCQTNDKGYCHITPTINKNPGVHTVYAEATKQGFTPDNSRSLTTQFTVWESRYEVLALTLYEDPYLIENYTFYRNNPIYASFSLRDTFTNQILSPNTNLVSEVFIRVNNQNELQFNKDTFTSNQFRFNLPMIPISDDYLGEGKVFSFVFNFTDNTAGQDQVVVNILNNELQFNPPSSFEMNANSELTIDFKPYVSDIETPTNQIEFTFNNFGDMQIQNLGNNVFKFQAPDKELRQFISVTADDTDGSKVTRQIIFDIIKQEQLTGPTADFTISPQNPRANQVVSFRSNITLGDAPIVFYEWTVDGVNVGSGPNLNHVFTTEGVFEVSLTVRDANGFESFVTKSVTILPPNVVPIADFEFSPLSPFTGDAVTFTSTSTQGSSSIVFYEWTVDGVYLNNHNSIISSTFNQEGTYDVSLTVTDENGLSSSIIKQINVSQRPTLQAPIANFTITPSELFVNEDIYFNSTSIKGSGEITSYAWYIDNDFITNEEFVHFVTSTQGYYNIRLVVQDENNLSNSITKTIFVSQRPTLQGPEVDFTYNPQNPLTNEVVNFVSNVTLGDAPIVYYEWRVSHQIAGLNQNLNYVFNNSGTYTVSIIVRDANGLEASIAKQIFIANPVFDGPTANFEFSPQNPITGDLVTFTSTSQIGDSNIITYQWFIDSSPLNTNASAFNWTFNYANSFDITLNVIDQNGLTDTITKQVIVTAPATPNLSLEELGCNANVVQGNVQHCSAYVTSNREEVEGAEVTFRYAHNNQIIGLCQTNFKGYCSINPQINLAPGTYEVYADVNMIGFNSDTSRTLRSQFTVWAHRYNIENLRVFSDAFMTEESTFYRSNAVYASFTVRDTFTNQIVPPTENLVSEVFIRVNNQNELQFNKITHSQEYRYVLNNLPISDDFLGQGQVFSFVFNFTDNTAGQDQVVVNILNNEVMFDAPQSIQISSGGSIDLDLKQYVSDVETPNNQIDFTFSNLGNLQVTHLGNNVFRITAPVEEFTQLITITADDTDGSVAIETMEVLVVDTEGLLGPVAMLQIPGSALANSQVTLNASNSYARSGTITQYKFEVFGFGEKVHEHITTNNFLNYEFKERGAHTVTLTVTDSSGRQASTSLQIDIGRNSPDIVIGDFEGLHISNIQIRGSDVFELDINEPFAVYATITNKRNERIDSLRLTFTIPELGFKTQGAAFSLLPGQSTQRQIVGYLPFEKEDILYSDLIATVGVSGSGFNRNRYIPVDVVWH